MRRKKKEKVGKKKKEEVEEEDEEEYKGRTDSNSPTGPNEAVCFATLLL